MNLNDDIKVLPMADDEDELTDSNRASLDNEHVIDFETNTVSIRKQKKAIPIPSSHEYVSDPNSESNQIKEKKSCYDTLKAHFWKVIIGIVVLIVGVFVIVYFVHQNVEKNQKKPSLDGQELNDKRVSSIEPDVAGFGGEKLKQQIIDAGAKLTELRQHSAQKEKLEIVFSAQGFTALFDGNEENWAYWYFFDDAMAKKQIEMKSLPEKLKENPSEFLRFVKAFHHVAVKETLSDDDYSDVDRLMTDAGFENALPAKKLSTYLQSSKSEDALVEALQCNIDAKFISEHLSSLHGQELFDFTVKYHLFFTKYPNSLLFGRRDDPQSFINFKIFLDAEIFVIDLDETLYSAQRPDHTLIQDKGHKQEIFELDIFEFGQMVWNPEFQHLFENGIFKGKKVYFYTAATQVLVEPDIESKIKQLCQKGNAEFKGIKYKSKEFREKRWPKLLRKSLKLTENKKILVIDNKPFEFRKDFDMEQASKEYPDAHRNLPKMNSKFEVESPCLLDAKDRSEFKNAHLLGVASFHAYEQRQEQPYVPDISKPWHEQYDEQSRKDSDDPWQDKVEKEIQEAR